VAEPFLRRIMRGDPLAESKELIKILDDFALQKSTIESGGTDKHTGHSYTGIYHSVFNQYDVSHETKILELGCLYGGSAVLWSQFLPASHIWCVDNNMSNFHPVNRSRLGDRVTFIEGNAYREETIERLKKECKNFDVIIDDAHHILETQQYVLDNYFSLLVSGGTLVIEDIPNVSALWSLANRACDQYPASRVTGYDLTSIRGNKDDYLLRVHKLGL